MGRSIDSRTMFVANHATPLQKTVADLRSDHRALTPYLDDVYDRIEAIDPALEAFVIERDQRERLRRAGAELLEQFPDTNHRPPLFGAVVGVKDIIHVDGLPTRAGTALPPELFAGAEATCVSRLRDAGAIVAGKTATTEFAGLAPATTRNPHHIGYSPGGSSSGSAAAVAAGLCPLAVGTQTGGSVIRPAAFCGVIGFKPSFGRIPRDGVIERSRSADHVGLFTQDLPGMSLAASVICDDWVEPDAAFDRSPRIGVPTGPYLERASKEGLERFHEHIRRLNRDGCEVMEVPVPTFEEFEALDDRHQTMVRAELAAVHEDWFDDYEGFYRMTTARTIERGRSVTDDELAAGRESRTALRAEVESLLEEHDLDLWAAPAAPGPAPETIRTTGDPVMNRPWTHAGVPVLTLPAGVADNGLPLGVQFAAPYMADEALLRWAEQLWAPLPARRSIVTPRDLECWDTPD